MSRIGEPACPADGRDGRGHDLATDWGTIHYWLSGPGDGQPLVLVHGATVPHWQFDALSPCLHRLGYRTLCPDLPGHGYSDRLAAALDLDFLAGSVETVMSHLGWTRDVYVLGHSLGAAVTARLALRQSVVPTALILTAPLLDYGAVSKTLLLMRAPLIGEVFMALYGMAALRRRRHRRYADIDRPDLAARFDKQLAIPGFQRALLSLARHGALGPHQPLYARLGASGLPTQVLWGTRDLVAPRDHAELVARLAGADLRRFEGLEHNLLLTAPQAVAQAMDHFYRQHAVAGPDSVK